jgi:hypothetical protein
MKNFFLKSVYCAVLICGVPAVFADTTSNIRYEQGWDDNDGDSRYLDIDLGLQDKNRIVAGYGKSTSLSGVDLLDSNSYYIGYITDPHADMSTGVTYTSITEQNNFNLDSIRLDLLFNTDDWAFTLAPELRNVEFYTSSTSTVTTLSPALGVMASYYGIDRVAIAVGHTAYSYDKNISSSSMHTSFIMRNLSTSTYDQAYGLDDYRNMLAARYNYGAGNIGVRHTRSVSFVDATATTVNTVYISYRFNETWRTELSAGTVDDGVTDSRFTSLALAYYW